METNQIIAEIDLEIARLQEVKAILSGRATSTAKRVYKSRSLARPVGTKKRVLSPEARAKIAAAQKARWAKAKKASK
jgi:hypothetical protein